MRAIVIMFLTWLLSANCLNINDTPMGTYGTSANVLVSKSNKLYRATYIPSQFEFKLLDKSIIKIDTVWAETMWVYDEDGKIYMSERIGYNFVIPIKKQEYEKFIFTFSLFDKNNQAFTNGIESKRCVLNPKHLKDTIKVLLEEKNPDTTYGWIKPIVTDTIQFVKRVHKE